MGRPKGYHPPSKYEEFRGADGKIDYSMARSKKRGKKKYVDLSLEERKQRVFMNGTPMEMLQCPFCGKLTPKNVAMDAMGEPKRPPAMFMKYVKVDGHIERRFAGIPADKLTPLATQYRMGGLGFFVQPKQSIPPSFLKNVDSELFNDFKRILQNTLNEFQ